MIQFGLRDLFIGTTLLALGLGLLILSFEPVFLRWEWLGILVVEFMWLGSGALIGAGLLWPIKLPWQGAILGAATEYVIFMALLAS